MATILIAHNFKTDSFAGMSYFLAHRLAAEGNRVVFLSHRPFFDRPRNYYDDRLKVYSWKSRERPTGVRDIVHFIGIFRRYRPDIVIGHFVGANISILVSKVLSLGRCRTFEYYHTLSSQIRLDIGDGIIEGIIQKMKFLRKRAHFMLFTDKVLAVSDMAKRDFMETYRMRKALPVLNPMVDTFLDDPPPMGERLTVGFLGRMEPSKGILPLIGAIRILGNRFRFKLAGSGSMEGQVTSVCDGRDVSYAGNLAYESIDGFIKSCDVIVVPSLKDNLVTVGIEALMNKRCLVISDQTALSEYMEDGIDCMKTAPESAAIAAVLTALDADRGRLLRIAERGRAKYETLFSMEGYIEKMKRILFAEA